MTAANRFGAGAPRGVNGGGRQHLRIRSLGYTELSPRRSGNPCVWPRWFTHSRSSWPTVHAMYRSGIGGGGMILSSLAARPRKRSSRHLPSGSASWWVMPPNGSIPNPRVRPSDERCRTTRAALHRSATRAAHALPSRHRRLFDAACQTRLNRRNSNSAPPSRANSTRNGSVMMSRASPRIIRIAAKIAAIMSSDYPRLRSSTRGHAETAAGRGSPGPIRSAARAPGTNPGCRGDTYDRVDRQVARDLGRRGVRGSTVEPRSRHPALRTRLEQARSAVPSCAGSTTHAAKLWGASIP